MGFAATWGEFTERVGFKNPTEEMRVAGVDYDPTAWTMEYRDDHFVGLEAAVSVRGSAQVVEIEGKEYWVRRVSRRLDGRTFVAELQPKPATFTPPAPPAPPDPDPDDPDAPDPDNPAPDPDPDPDPDDTP